HQLGKWPQVALSVSISVRDHDQIEQASGLEDRLQRVLRAEKMQTVLIREQRLAQNRETNRMSISADPSEEDAVTAISRHGSRQGRIIVSMTAVDTPPTHGEQCRNSRATPRCASGGQTTRGGSVPVSSVCWCGTS